MVDIVAVYYAMTTEPPKSGAPTHTSQPAQPPARPAADVAYSADKPSAGDLAAYVAKAVTEECEALRIMPPDSGRNDRLNQAAFSLGTLVGAGALDRFDAENALYDAAHFAGLEDGEIFATIASGMDAGVQQPRDLSTVQQSQRNHGYKPDYDVTGEDAQAFLDEGGEPVEFNPWPYAEFGGRMCYCTESETDGVKRFPIADFVAKNVEEIVDEDGSRTITIAGRALRGGAFRLEVNGKAFGEDRTLRSLLEQAAGARDPVYNRMAGHLASAIKKLTRDEELTVIRRFKRTGWYAGQFLMPGMHGDDIHIELPTKLPYGVDPKADVDKALQALGNLVKAIDPACTTPVLAMMFEAPLHRLAKGRKRYGVFIQGRTGSLKTSWTQTAMCIYGDGWIDDGVLLKWGEGATRNAIMRLAASAHDMPFFIDNYKPNIGDGAEGFNALVHNIIEGGDKERLRRDGSLIASLSIHAFPLSTGEDVPQTDSASLARLFVVQFPWQAGDANPALSAAQADAHHLSAIGRMWLEWISSAEGRAAIASAAEVFPALRDKWSHYLRKVRIDAGNPLRIAENLASNELAWRIACQHPQIGAVLKPHSEVHLAGLRAIAARMADSTADALEAVQFVNAIKELIVSKQYILVQRQIGEPPDFDAGKVLGWYDENGVYLLPAMALAAARKVLGTGSLPISPRTLNDQLARRGMLMPGADRSLKTIRVAARTVRVMHLRAEVFIEDDGEQRSLLEELGI